MEAHLTRTPGGFFWPSAEVDLLALSGIGQGETVRCIINRPRNPGHHRKMFALLQIVMDNSDRYNNVDELLTELKLQTGHYREHVTLDGEMVLVPKSIAFSAMDQDTFNEFYRRVLDVVVEKLIQGSTHQEFERRVAEVAGFF